MIDMGAQPVREGRPAMLASRDQLWRSTPTCHLLTYSLTQPLTCLLGSPDQSVHTGVNKQDRGMVGILFMRAHVYHSTRLAYRAIYHLTHIAYRACKSLKTRINIYNLLLTHR